MDEGGHDSATPRKRPAPSNGASSSQAPDTAEPSTSYSDGSSTKQLTFHNLVNCPINLGSCSETTFTYGGSTTTDARATAWPTDMWYEYNRPDGRTGKETKFNYHDLLQDSGLPYGEELINVSALGNATKVQEIISRRPDAVKFLNKQGQTPLHAASYGGHLDVVDTLVTSNRALLERQDKEGQTPLAYAVLGNEPEVVRYLLKAGSKINALNKHSHTPLFLATFYGHLECVKILLGQEECDVNCKKSNGFTPLFIAIFRNDKPIIELLVRRPDVDHTLKDNQERNCLHHAVVQGNSFAIERILEAAPTIIDNVLSDGHTALHLAAMSGHKDAVLTLVKQENCEKEFKNIQGKTALHLAVEHSRVECVKALLDNGADVNAQDKADTTCLHVVMLNVFKDAALRTARGAVSPPTTTWQAIFQQLIEHPGIDIELKNNQEHSCLHFAAQLNNIFAIEKILVSVPKLINLTQNDGKTALHIAAYMGYTDIVLILVKQEKCLKDHKDNEGQTALHLAVIGRRYECIKALLDHGANVNAQDRDGNTSLHCCMMSRRITETLSAKTDQERGEAVFSTVSSVLDDTPIIKLLSEHAEADLRKKNKSNFNVLHLAGNIVDVETILKKAPSLINSIATDGHTALHIAASNGDKEIVLTLMKQEKCKKDPKNSKEQTPLHLAIELSRYECAKALISNGVDVNARDKDGNTGLHLLMTQITLSATTSKQNSTEGNLSTIQLLLEHPKVNLTITNNKSHNCCLHAAFHGNHLGIERILKVDPSLTNSTAIGGTTALHIAAANGFFEIMKTILQHDNCRKDVKHIDGRTPLHMAVECRQYQCMKILLDNGADVNAQDINGNTSIHLILDLIQEEHKRRTDAGKTLLKFIIAEDDKNIFQFLVQHRKADLKLENGDDFNCLQYATVKKNVYAVDQILKVNSSLINTTGSLNRTALHIAASTGFLEALLCLLKQKTCKIDKKCQSGQTALHLAIEKCHFECTKALLDSGANVNAQDIHGNTSLHLVIKKVLTKNFPTDDGDPQKLFCAFKTNKQVVRLLVVHPKINLTLANKAGFNCLHLAAINGNSFALRSILKANPSLITSMFGKDRTTALHLAALNGHTDEVAALCEQENCETDRPNVHGQTALHLATDCCNTKSVEILLNKRANVNAQDKDGDTCMHLLMTKASNHEAETTPPDVLQIITLFVEHKDINLALINKKGDSCLHCSVFVGNYAVEKILKAAPSVINSTSQTFTALHIASLYGKADVVQTLAKQGNCIKDLQNGNGQTALHLAIDKNHYNCIEALVNNDADVNTQDKDGNTSLHLVMMKESTRDILMSASKEQLVDLGKLIKKKSDVRDEKTNLVALIITLLEHGAKVRKMNSKEKNVLDLSPNADVKSFLAEFNET